MSNGSALIIDAEYQPPGPAMQVRKRSELIFISILSLAAALTVATLRLQAEEPGRLLVPSLPDEPLDYTALELPKYIDRDALAESDNTPAGNPITNHGTTLGRVLFYDRRLSKNNSTSCASCHDQKAGFSDPRRFSPGFAGGHTKRNSMGLANLRFSNLEGRRPGFFWDERAATLEAQVLMPIQDEVEMGMELAELEIKLAKLPYYPPLFKAAFGSPVVSRDRIAKALAQFLRALVSFESKFDQGAAAAADLTSDFDNFSELENRGKSLFLEGPGGIAEFACVMCHIPPTFNMPAAANIGLDLVYRDQGLGALDRPSNDSLTPTNDGKFKAPSLRNVALTAPYMHDGRFNTLEQVLQHYSNGVHPHQNLGLAFEIQPGERPTSGFNFSPAERAALVAFLKTLTDRSIISDEKFSDPFVRSRRQNH